MDRYLDALGCQFSPSRLRVKTAPKRHWAYTGPLAKKDALARDTERPPLTGIAELLAGYGICESFLVTPANKAGQNLMLAGSK